MHERGDGDAEGRRVQQQDHLAEQQRLADDRRGDRQVHRIPHVPVQPADDQVLGRSDRCRRADTFDDKACEGLQQDDDTGGEQDHPNDPERQPVRQRLSHIPARQQPGHETGDDSRRQHEKDEAARCRPHDATSVTPSQ